MKRYDHHFELVRVDKDLFTAFSHNRINELSEQGWKVQTMSRVECQCGPKHDIFVVCLKRLKEEPTVLMESDSKEDGAYVRRLS